MLTAANEILGFQRPPWSERGHNQANEICEQPQSELKKSDHAPIMPQPRATEAKPDGVDRIIADHTTRAAPTRSMVALLR